MKTFKQYVEEANLFWIGNLKTQRKGQAYMNYLHSANAVLYNEITATDADPFYNDGLVPYFLQVVESRWEATINA